MKGFIDKLMLSYSKHEHLKDLVEYDMGISSQALIRMTPDDFQQVLRTQAMTIEDSLLQESDGEKK
jgi:hypothetical protein